jgi:cytochrome b
MPKHTKVWDLPTRIFHVALAILVFAAFLTVNLGDDWMQLHGQIGLSVLALISFRVLWGIVGGHWSQFKNFPLHPSQILGYLKKGSAGTSYPGHNPLGSLSTLLMLAVFLLQGLTGLCSDDEVLFSGPLTPYLSSTQVELATFYHSEIGQPLIILIVSLHVLAILFYKYFLKQNLVMPMITGYKNDLEQQNESKDSKSTRLLGLCLFLIIFSIIFYLLPI